MTEPSRVRISHRPEALALRDAIAQRVRQRRADLDMSMAELARRADVNIRQIWNVENEMQDTRIATLQALARALDIPLTDLVADRTT